MSVQFICMYILATRRTASKLIELFSSHGGHVTFVNLRDILNLLVVSLLWFGIFQICFCSYLIASSWGGIFWIISATIIHSKQWSRLSTISLCPCILPHTTMPLPQLTWQLSLIHLWPLDPTCHTILSLTLDLTRHTNSYLSINQTKVFTDFLSFHNYPRRTEPRHTTQPTFQEKGKHFG